jgi:hypothetical protein
MTHEEEENDVTDDTPLPPLEFSKEDISSLPMPGHHPFARCDDMASSSDDDDFYWDSECDDLPM